MLAAPPLGKHPLKVPNLKPSKFVGRLCMSTLKDLYQKCTVLKVDLLSDHQIHCFACEYVCTFQHGNFTSCGSEGVKADQRKNKNLNNNKKQQKQQKTTTKQQQQQQQQQKLPPPPSKKQQQQKTKKTRGPVVVCCNKTEED